MLRHRHTLRPVPVFGLLGLPGVPARDVRPGCEWPATGNVWRPTATELPGVGKTLRKQDFAPTLSNDNVIQIEAMTKAGGSPSTRSSCGTAAASPGRSPIEP